MSSKIKQEITEYVNTHREKLGRDFKETRTALGWSVEQVAEMAGVKPITIEKIEAGKFNVSLDIMVRVADVLGSDVTIKERE